MAGAWLIAAMLGASVPSPQLAQGLEPRITATASVSPPDDGTRPSEARPPGRDWLFDFSIAGVSGGNASDLTLTLYALHRGRGEANPVLQPLGHHPVEFAVAKTGMTVVTMYALVKLHDRRPKLATAIAAAAATLMIAVAAHNARLVRGAPR